MGAVDMAAMARFARSRTREEFIARHPHLYLVIAENPEAVSWGFETAVVSSFRGGVKLPSPNVDLEIIEVSKAAGNPYPERISVGRARNCDLVLRHPSVSKLHAHFHVKEDGRLDVVDLESANGTRVNGRPVTANSPQWIGPGDTVMFGALAARLVDADALFDLLQE